MTGSSRPESTEARLIVWSAARLIQRARETAPDYAARGGPAGTHMVSRLVTEAGCFLTRQPMGPGLEAMALPRIGGVSVLVLNADAPQVEHDFAVRHELAHVLADQLDEPTFLDGHSEGWAERVADLFALADLIPAPYLRGARRAEVEEMVAAWAPSWTPERVRDRARLRVALLRRAGV